ncbi:MAG: helix-turn-helix transcriptional regulator [Oscillibacter sp.]|nr:helix-turn-helix transcriptional regulator [Oscillibacter sp.]
MTFREMRKAAGLTQPQLAEKTGIFIRQIQKMESGETAMANITLGNAVKLAVALGVRPEDLLGAAGDR